MKSYSSGVGIVVSLLLVMIIGGGGYAIAAANHKEQKTCTVTSKETVYSGSQGDTKRDYRVYTEECGTLEVYDQLLVRSFDAADRYGRIKEGGTYNFVTAGYRVPFLSLFPNIIEAKEIK